ncbi:MFS transporter [Alteromonas sp. a30]|uniref:MFS transporter n=1 Tax=Alteromonas sp. a30 TaxID=2730917 RepID=UPI00227FECA8|nr:MFS transporter [Alteromonas sp. a30]MCY7293962.1 MFS transporter [Alteromonas sp. a30]
MNKAQAYQALFAIMMLTLLSVVGMAMPYPILTPLLLEGSNPINQFIGIHPKLLLAALLAGYPLGILLGSSFIGSLSDVFGRKRTLLLTTLGSATGYLVTAFAAFQESFLLLLAARFFTGLCEGNIAIARAMCSDLHPIIDKTRAMSMVYSVTYSGWLIGPLVGGYLMLLGADFSFMIAAAITFASALVILLFVHDPEKTPSNAEPERKIIGMSGLQRIFQHAIRHNAYTLLSNTSIRHVFWQYLIIMLGLNAFYEFLPVWLHEDLNQDSVGIGHMTALVTLAMVLTSTVFIERCKGIFGIKPLIIAGLVVFGIAQSLSGIVDNSTVLYYCLVSGSAIAFFNVLLPVFLSDNYNHIEQGKLFGLLTSTFCLSNVIIALFGGAISLLGAANTLIFGGFLMFVGALYFHLYFSSESLKITKGLEQAEENIARETTK